MCCEYAETRELKKCTERATNHQRHETLDDYVVCTTLNKKNFVWKVRNEMFLLGFVVDCFAFTAVIVVVIICYFVSKRIVRVNFVPGFANRNYNVRGGGTQSFLAILNVII